MAEFRQDTFVVNLKNGVTMEYVIRGLRDDEIETWAAFCASVFSYKANPPPASYFERHYRNDPSRVASLVRVALHQGQMVASCRLFLRTVSDGAGSPLSAGGIGEVCTADDHRRRGLSKILLQNVMEIMKNQQLQVSLLHAAPAFSPVYEKAGGYVSTVSHWSVIPIATSKLQLAAKGMADTVSNTTGSSTLMIREAFFPSDSERLSTLHQKYSEQRFVGCIIRSSEYWNGYLSMELKGSLWVLEVGARLVAWLSLRSRGDRFQLREFGYDKDCSVPGFTTSTALSMLLAHAIKQVEIAPDLTNMDDEWLLVVPTFLLDECRSQGGDECLSYVNWSRLIKDDDLGWMYKILDEKISIESINDSRTPHLIWPADSF